MIDKFVGNYRFLSNFYIEPDGTHVEGEYQWAKSVNPEERFCLFGMSPYAAKKYGRTIKIREDWDQVKLQVMYSFVLKKFTEHEELRSLLLATGQQDIVEGNYWGDVFWGVCKGEGQNHLGKILKQVRKKILAINCNNLA